MKQHYLISFTCLLFTINLVAFLLVDPLFSEDGGENDVPCKISVKCSSGIKECDATIRNCENSIGSCLTFRHDYDRCEARATCGLDVEYSKRICDDGPPGPPA